MRIVCPPQWLIQHAQVLGAYAEDLGIEDQEVRIKAVKLLGAVFSVGTYHTDFSQAFAEFKRRSVDKDSDVRKALVNVMQALVTKRPEMGKVLMEDEWNYMGGSREAPLSKLVIDMDEGVRKDAVSAILSVCLINSEAVPQAVLESVAERVLDKKFSVRKQAMEGLAMLWQKYCAPIDSARLSKSVAEKFEWIPSKLLMVAPMDVNRGLVVHCVEDICLSPLNSERSTAAVALDFYSSLDAKGKDILGNRLCKARGRFCEEFIKFCRLREQVATDMDLDDGEKSEAAMLQKLSHHFPEPGSAHDHLQKLHALKGQIGIKIWQLLENLVMKPTDHAGNLKVQEEVLKRLGPKHPELQFVKTLIAKLSDKCFGIDFIRLALESVIEDEADRAAAAKKCLALIPKLAGLNKALVLGEESSLDALLTSRCNDLVVCENVLRTIAVAGEQMPRLRKSKQGIETIKELCMHDSWTVAKYAVRALVALGCDDSGTLGKLAQTAAENVAFGNKLPSTLRVILEVAKVCPEAVEKDRETVSKFVHRRLLRGAWPASAGRKDRNVVIDSKVQGMKLLAALSFHDEDANDTALLEVCEKIIVNGGEIQSGDNSTPKGDKIVLRRTAGCCIIKVAKEWSSASRVSPVTFAALSNLFEDEETSVKETIMRKVFKGTASEHGKLPFYFASLYALLVHDAESKIVDHGKAMLRNTLNVMDKIKKTTGSEVVSIMAESILPWLIYVLVVHSEYADPDEDATQAAVAYKKHFDFFFNNVPNELQNAAAMLQLVQYIRKCSIPAKAALQRPPKVIERNLALATDVAERLLQSNKKWTTRGFASASFLSKVVNANIFSEKSRAKDTEDTKFELSPAKDAGSSNKSPAKLAEPTEQEIDSPGKSPIKSPMKSPAKSSRGRTGNGKLDFMQIEDDHFEGNVEEEDPDGKGSSSVEEDQEGGRRPDSARQARAGGKKVHWLSFPLYLVF